MNPPCPRQLISFDIGIKHLAYCIFEYIPTPPSTPPEYNILEWKIINLLETETDDSTPIPATHLCQTSLKPVSKKVAPKICGKCAQYYSPQISSPNTTEYYCNKHANLQTQYLHPQNPQLPKYSTAQLTKMEKPALQEYANQLSTQNSIHQTTNQTTIPTTKKSLIPYIQTLQQSIYLQPVPTAKPTVKANRANMVDLCHSLFKQLLQIESRFPQIQQVVIENQIGNIAARMMVIQGMATMFYTSRNRNIQIEHVSSSHKLKYAASLVSLPAQPQQSQQNNPETPNPQIKTKTKYQEHKSHAKDYCEMILLSDPKFSVFYEEFKGNKKKKDDLADCFLQGIWSMGHGNLAVPGATPARL
jgi:hypothetical protein